MIEANINRKKAIYERKQIEKCAKEATYKAYLKAKELGIPIIIMENNKLYEEAPDGSRKFIEELEKIKRPFFPKSFRLW